VSKIDVLKEIKIHVVRLDSMDAWAHTHGMAKFGKAELEIKGVPVFMAPFTGAILNQTCDYILNSARSVQVNEVMQIGTSQFRLVAADPDPDHYKGHYDHARWELVDPDISGCGCCESCKKESGAALN